MQHSNKPVSLKSVAPERGWQTFFFLFSIEQERQQVSLCVNTKLTRPTPCGLLFSTFDRLCFFFLFCLPGRDLRRMMESFWFVCFVASLLASSPFVAPLSLLPPIFFVTSGQTHPEYEAVWDEESLQARYHRLRLKPSRRRRHDDGFTL